MAGNIRLLMAFTMQLQGNAVGEEFKLGAGRGIPPGAI